VLSGVHDVSEGGLGATLAEMAVASEVGFRVRVGRGHVGLFNEAPSRVVVCVPAQAVAEVAGRADAAGVEVRALGEAGGDRLIVEGVLDVGSADAMAAWRAVIPAALGHGSAH
jgi:phosphoribosylformylglycinamidine synthase